MWLRFGTVGASEFRAGRARPLLLLLLVVLFGRPSGNVLRAGVEGLLARPLLVVVTCCVVMVGVAAGVFSFRTSSSAGLTEPSFLGPGALAEEGVGTRSFCCLEGSIFAVALGGSICVIFGVSLGPRAPLGGGISSGGGTMPFGLVAAAEGGRCLSTFDAVEFWRALADAGRPEMEGAGEARGGFVLSGKAPTTGDDATDGEAAGPAL